MGIRGLLAACFILLLPGEAFTQELSHQVMVPAAGIITAGSVELYQTIGESAVELFDVVDFKITQGFQQPRMIISSSTKPEGTGVRAYPNPATDILTIELFGEITRSFNISILNIYGAEVFKTELNFTGPYWYKLEQPVTELAPGLYLVRILSGDKVIRRTIKIEKM